MDERNPTAPHELPATVPDRLESVRQALGADLLVLARRLAAPAPAPAGFRVLATAPELAEPESAVPPEFFGLLLRQARRVHLDSERAGDEWGARLRRLRARALLGWPLPEDRAVSVLFAAVYRRHPGPEPTREAVARAGMEALARAVALPAWLAPGRGAGAEEDLPPVLAGDDPRLQSMRRRARATRVAPPLSLVVGPEGSGRRDLARWLLRAHAPRVEFAEGDLPVDLSVGRGGSWIARADQLDGRAQALLLAGGEGAHGLATRPGCVLAGPDLGSRVRAETFRPELLERLHPVRWELPALARRVDDLPAIFESICRQRGHPRTSLGAGARRRLLAGPWTASMSELEGLVDRCLASGGADRRLRTEDLPLPDPAVGPRQAEGTLQAVLDRVERDLLRRALRAAEGNKSVAARELGLSRQGLYRRLERHGMIARPRAVDSRESCA